METTKERRDYLIRIANSALKVKKDVLLENDQDILDSYNGQVASLSVSVAMSGLLPTLAIFYQDQPDEKKKKAYRKNVLEVIAEMITEDSANNWTFENAKKLLEYAVSNPDKDKDLKKEVTECAIALKQVVRTYNLA